MRFDRLNLSETARAEVDQALEQVAQGNQPKFSEEVQKTLVAKMAAINRKIQKQREARQSGASAGHGGSRGDGRGRP